MPSELVFFHQGLSTDARSAIQKPGFVKDIKNILLEVDGKQSLRPFFSKVNTTPVGSIHSVKYWRNMLLVGDGANLRADFTLLGSAFSGDPWGFKVFKGFITASDGRNFILVDENSNTYSARVANPTTASSGVAGAAGNPDGVYRLYVSYFITWPNGHTYETGLSPASGDVTVSLDAISWSSIPICPYAAIYGSAPTIYRNLYRGPGTGGTLTQIYLVDTILDNTTTTYTDDLSDTSLQLGFVQTNSLYIPSLVPKFFDWHYGRLFMIDPDHVWRLYYTEVAAGNTAESNESLMPLAMTELNWDDLRVGGFDEVDPQAILSWGSYLYIALKQTWIRKQGDDPENWAYRKTYADRGIIAPFSTDVSSVGVFGVSSPVNRESGIVVFNGQTTEVVSSPLLDQLFKDDLDFENIQNCRGRIAGKYYFLLYPSVDGTEKILAMDIRRYPEIRVGYWTDLYGHSIEVDRQGKNFYFGGSDGYVRLKGGAEAVNVTIESHDLIGGTPELDGEVKTWKELKYALDTASSAVTLQVYIDEVLKKWPDGATAKSISGSADVVQVIKNLPLDWMGYKIKIVISGIGLTQFVLYSPWKLDFTV